MICIKAYKARDFNKGKSAQIFKEAHDNNVPIKVIRNSEEYVVILSFEQYLELTQHKEGEYNGK